MVPVTDGMKDMSLEGENGSNGGTSPRPRVDGGEYCPRCDKQVFIAEKRQAAGNVSHCASHKQKSLSSHTTPWALCCTLIYLTPLSSRYQS